ncbi:7SK snRNA methylphosphate capping enzyme isoform X2 [Halyomorpha halys]|uniref:7SK snRNA methylphosphate capping enzyme isoform X2 n=1 Tax=Halyomorpha halys TaxID=286706 RepID=UPI0034D1987A
MSRTVFVINRAMNAVTPKSSPLPTPKHRKGEVEVIIPADINDPLALAGGEDNDEAYAASFNTSHPHAARKIKKKNKKKRSKGNSVSKDDSESKLEEVKVEEAKEGETSTEVSLTEELDKPKDEEKEKEKEKEFKRPKLTGLEKREKKSSQELKDKIVSPVIPQPGAWPGSSRFRKQGHRRSNQATPKFNEKSRRFQYGNYNRYYGYRNLGQESDPRLKVLVRLQHFFAGRDVLDIGCNTGIISVAVARDLGARSVIGIDIDKSLVEAARQRLSRSSSEFPVSMPLVFGALDVPGVQEANTFPHNLTFIQGNYVLEDDVLVELEQAQFDVILCLSVTKWFHLNWGDDGLKRAFKRMFSQLRPGGVLILEPQDWSSYSRKKTLTETIWMNYQNIKFFPAKFTEYLLSEVGFSKCEVVGAPMHPQKGFQRPIKLFTKGETPPSQTPRGDSQTSLSIDTPLKESSSSTAEDIQTDTLSRLASDVSISEGSARAEEDIQTDTLSRLASDVSISGGSATAEKDIQKDTLSRLTSDISKSGVSTIAEEDIQRDTLSRLTSDISKSGGSANIEQDIQTDTLSRFAREISTSEDSSVEGDIQTDTLMRFARDTSTRENSGTAKKDIKTNKVVGNVSGSESMEVVTDSALPMQSNTVISENKTMPFVKENLSKVQSPETDSKNQSASSTGTSCEANSNMTGGVVDTSLLK